MLGMRFTLIPNYIPNDGLIFKRSLLKSDQKEVKRLLERLASQEREHKQRIEFLYTEVAFPQTNVAKDLWERPEKPLTAYPI